MINYDQYLVLLLILTILDGFFLLVYAFVWFVLIISYLRSISNFCLDVFRGWKPIDMLISSSRGRANLAHGST